MTDTAILAESEQDALTAALLRVVQRKGMTTHDLALSAFVQNAATQAALQALMNHIKRKNLMSREELDRCLVGAYHDARAAAEAQGLIVSPIARPQGH